MLESIRWFFLPGTTVTEHFVIGSPSGKDALPNGLDVTFEVTEIKRLTGSYNTMVGNNEGSMVRNTDSVLVFGWIKAGCAAILYLILQVLGLKLPNVFGRAEKFTFQFSYGTKETSYGLSFFKPQPGYFERKYVTSVTTFAS